MAKDPVGTKGARVTTHITLAGRSLVLMPTVDYVGVSRRIEKEDERGRLRKILNEIKPKIRYRFFKARRRPGFLHILPLLRVF